MSHELNKAAKCYGCYDGENIIGMIGVLHFPHPTNKKIKTITRLCILPDYQGIGIGKKFLTEVAKIYAKKGFDVKITTSAKNLIVGLQKMREWRLVRYSQKKAGTCKMLKTCRQNVRTATFFFENF